MGALQLPGPVRDGPAIERCGVCGAPLGGEFCAGCGERRPGEHDYRLLTLAGDVARDVTSADGKVLRSARSLLTAPGDLTAAYFDGRRGLFTKPTSLFVVLNLIFFLIVPHTGLLSDSYARFVADGDPVHARLLAHAATAAHVSTGIYAERFDARLTAYKQSTLLFLIPAFAIAVMITSLATRSGRRRFAVEHVLFSVHTVTFFLVASLVLLLPTMIGLILLFRVLATWTPLGGTLASALDSDIATPIIFSGVVGWYIKHASQRFYGDSALAATARSAVLTVAFFALIQGYREAIFYATVWTA